MLIPISNSPPALQLVAALQSFAVPGSRSPKCRPSLPALLFPRALLLCFASPFEPQAAKLIYCSLLSPFYTFFYADPFSWSTLSPSHTGHSWGPRAVPSFSNRDESPTPHIRRHEPQRREREVPEDPVYWQGLQHCCCSYIGITTYLSITIYSINNEQYWTQQQTDKIGLTHRPRYLFKTHLFQDLWRLRRSRRWLRCSSCTNFILFHFIAWVSRLLALLQARTRSFCDYKAPCTAKSLSSLSVSLQLHKSW